MNKQLQLHTRTYITIRSKYISEKKEFEKKYDKINLRFLFLIFAFFIIFLLINGYIESNPNLISNEYYFLIIVIMFAIGAFLISMYFSTKYRIRDSFICVNCLHNVIPRKINRIICNLCFHPVYSFDEVIEGCPNCHDTIRFIKCPICGSIIDLDAPYDVEYLKRKRYGFK